MCLKFAQRKQGSGGNKGKVNSYTAAAAVINIFFNLILIGPVAMKGFFLFLWSHLIFRKLFKSDFKENLKDIYIFLSI